MTQLGLETIRDNEEIRQCTDCDNWTYASNLDTYDYCPDCHSEHVSTCEECNEECFTDDMIQHDGEYLCQDCFDRYYTECADCSAIVLQNDAPYCESCGKTYCEDCHENKHVSCIDCGDTICMIHDNYLNGNHSNIHYCESCAEHYITCEDCGDVVYEDDAYYTDYGSYCQSCYDDRQESDAPIQDYHDVQHWFKYAVNGERSYTMGYELEVCAFNGADCNTSAQHIIDNYSDGKRLFCIEHDGSLDDGNGGMEIISHAMTLEFHKERAPWQAMLAYLKNEGFRSHNTSCCGLHVHVEKARLTQEQRINIALFTNLQIDRLERLGRRTSDEYAKFDRNILLKTDEDKIYNRDRYSAVNWRNPDTVEFRFPRGTMQHATLIATLELIESIVTIAEIMPVETASNTAESWAVFTAYVNNHADRYAELIAYMEKRQIN